MHSVYLRKLSALSQVSQSGPAPGQWLVGLS